MAARRDSDSAAGSRWSSWPSDGSRREYGVDRRTRSMPRGSRHSLRDCLRDARACGPSCRWSMAFIGMLLVTAPRLFDLATRRDSIFIAHPRSDRRFRHRVPVVVALRTIRSGGVRVPAGARTSGSPGWPFAKRLVAAQRVERHPDRGLTNGRGRCKAMNVGLFPLAAGRSSRVFAVVGDGPALVTGGATDCPARAIDGSPSRLRICRCLFAIYVASHLNYGPQYYVLFAIPADRRRRPSGDRLEGRAEVAARGGRRRPR